MLGLCCPRQGLTKWNRCRVIGFSHTLFTCPSYGWKVRSISYGSIVSPCSDFQKFEEKTSLKRRIFSRFRTMARPRKLGIAVQYRVFSGLADASDNKMQTAVNKHPLGLLSDSLAVELSPNLCVVAHCTGHCSLFSERYSLLKIRFAIRTSERGTRVSVTRIAFLHLVSLDQLDLLRQIFGQKWIWSLRRGWHNPAHLCISCIQKHANCVSRITTEIRQKFEYEKSVNLQLTWREYKSTNFVTIHVLQKLNSVWNCSWNVSA